MRLFLAELYVPAGEDAQVGRRIEEATAAVASSGRPIVLSRVLSVAEDEICFVTFRAEAVTQVIDVGRRARVVFARVSEAEEARFG